MAAAAEIKGIGARLRKLRHDKGMSLNELAKASGVPRSTISKIENSQLKPSLVHAINLAQALDENLGFLINRDLVRLQSFALVRFKDRKQINLPEMSLSLQDLHGAFTPGVLEARIGIIEHGSHSGEEAMRHDGEEFCYILEGGLQYRIGAETYDLSRGDSIQFKCSTPHSWKNIAPGITRVLWVFSKQLSF